MVERWPMPPRALCHRSLSVKERTWPHTGKDHKEVDLGSRKRQHDRPQSAPGAKSGSAFKGTLPCWKLSQS